jgi:hypothetical protein
VRQLRPVVHVNAKQSFRNAGSAKLFFGPFSPSLRFRAQLFADFVAININIGSGSVSSSLITTSLLLALGFHPFFISLGRLAPSNSSHCSTACSGRKLLGIGSQRIGRVALVVPVSPFVYYVNAMFCFPTCCRQFTLSSFNLALEFVCHSGLF